MAVAYNTAATFLEGARMELEDEGGNLYGEDELLRYLNEGLRTIWHMVTIRWPAFFDALPLIGQQAYVIAVGVADYALPVDFLAIRYFDLNGVVPAAEHLAVKDMANSAADGYLLFNGNIRLLPTPTVAGAATLYYIPQYTPVLTVLDPVPLVIPFADVVKQYMVIKGRTRNNEDPGVVTSAYEFLTRSVFALVSAHNRPDDTGAKVLYRNFI